MSRHARHCFGFLAKMAEARQGLCNEPARAGHGLADGLGPSRSQVGRGPLSDLGRDPRCQMPDRPHRAVQGRLSADPLRGHPRHRLRPRALLLAASGGARQPAAGRGRRRAAHHLRPAAPPSRTHGAPAALHAAGRRQAGSQGARGMQRADRCLHRQGPVRRRGRLCPAHPRAPHRPHARHPRQRRLPVPQADPRHPRAGHHRPVRAGARTSWS